MMKRNLKKYFTIGYAVPGMLLILAACSNPVDILEEVTRTVMEANSRYIEVVSVSPDRNEETNASALIMVDFDRSIDSDSLDGNIIVEYSGDSANQVTAEWDIEYNESLKRLTINADPWLESNRTVTVTIQNIRAEDGSELTDPYEWSFITNSEPAFNLTIDAEYANALNYASIPVTLEFSSTANIYYYLSSDNSLTSTDVSSIFNPASADWVAVSDSTMSDSFAFSTQGASVPLYLWVYEDGVDGLGIISTNNKTETEYLLVDWTPPSGSFSLPSITNNNIVTADMTGLTDNVSGIAKYEFSNDSSSLVWTEDTTPGSSESLTIRDNAGTRAVYCRATDNVGNVMGSPISAYTNYYMPVKVKLNSMTLSAADGTLYLTEEWYWNLSVNSTSAFSRSSTTPFSYGIGKFTNKTVTSVAAAYIEKYLVDKNSAIPYTYTAYVDVTTAGTVSLGGYVAEEDGKIDQVTDTGWFTYITTDAQSLTATPTSNSYSLADNTLTGISVGIDYWADVEYAGLNSAP